MVEKCGADRPVNPSLDSFIKKGLSRKNQMPSLSVINEFLQLKVRNTPAGFAVYHSEKVIGHIEDGHRHVNPPRFALGKSNYLTQSLPLPKRIFNRREDPYTIHKYARGIRSLPEKAEPGGNTCPHTLRPSKGRERRLHGRRIEGKSPFSSNSPAKTTTGPLAPLVHGVTALTEEEKIQELTLLLLYLTSWEEREFDEAWQRSWKGYPFDTLDALGAERLISGSKRAKSIYLTDKGVEKAKELEAKYFGSR